MMRVQTSFRMEDEHPNNRNNMQDHSMKSHSHAADTGGEIPLAYAQESGDYGDGVFALPLANASTPGSLVRMTPEQETKLKEHGFPVGLSHELVKIAQDSLIRFWIIDNSGSMWTSDGNVLRGTGRTTTLIPCTRWAEMQATVEYHAGLAGLLEVTTIFHMLNHPGDPRVPQQFSIAEHGANNIPEDIEKAKHAMLTCQPQGPTPLAERMTDIRHMLEDLAPKLGRNGQKATIVVATDGLPTDSYGSSTPEAAREFVQILRSLQSFPVWLVIRLCTDDEDTRRFYNSLDEELELPLEVVDDHVAEAKEVCKFNNWLNYALPLHRTRELGYQHRLFDLLDERPLNKDEAKEFFELLFGKPMFANSPDVHDDWRGFLKHMTKVVKTQPNQWNPKTQKMEPWVDVKKLDKACGERMGLFARMGSSARRQSSRRSKRESFLPS